MPTNKVDVAYNMENIDRDFDIYLVDKANKDYYKYNILDGALIEFKAAAVQWQFGAMAFVLFHKGEVTEQKFKESIMKEYEDVKIQKMDLFNEEDCKKFQYNKRLLCQLLMNSMRTPKSEKFKYHNLTGKLYYSNPSWNFKFEKAGEINLFRFLEVIIEPGMYLNLNQVSYIKCEEDEVGKGTHVIDSKTGEFRKKLKTDKNTVTYKKGTYPHRRFPIKSFDINSYSQFKKCKLGIMDKFLREVEEKLSDYVSIELTEPEKEQEYELSKIEKKEISEIDYGNMLRKRGVVIVDENHSEKSKKIIQSLQHELETYYGIQPKVGILSKDAYNIRIIHSKEYYEDKEIQDPHSDNMIGYIVQHLVEEEDHFMGVSKSHSSADVKKIIQELIIKGEVRDGKISIFDWQRLNLEKEWTFVVRKKEKTNSSKEKIFTYYRLKIDSTGKMKFDTYCDKDSIECEEWEYICHAYNSTRSYQIRNQIEGLVYSDIQNIQVILSTPGKSLPNIRALSEALKQTDNKEKISKELLLKAIDDFKSVDSEATDYVENWKRVLSEKPLMITKKETRNILNMKNRHSKQFNRFFHEKYGVWLFGEFRDKEFEPVYQLENLLNIKYQYYDNDFDYGHSFIYYVGAKNKRRSYPSSCCMRKVISVGDGVIEFNELLPLMAVDFVRNNQYTVLPFPFKYLREFVEQN